MVKRIKTQHNDHVCDDCKWREWHKQQWNLDRDGKPLTYHCTMGQFTHAEVRGRKACELWDEE